MATTKPLVPDVTPTQIAQWKEKFQRIKKVEFKTYTGEVLEYIVAKPTLDEMDMLTKYSTDGDTEKVRQVLTNSLVLAGDDSRLSEIDVQNTVYGSIFKMAERLPVKEKEL